MPGRSRTTTTCRTTSTPSSSTRVWSTPAPTTAAVGVIEHLGIRNYPDYFARVHELLVPGGLFLNHGITHEKHWRRSSQTEFLERHVFPNGEMDNVSHILDVLERARFEIRDVESLREHYARTTRQWAERLQASAARARALAGERIYRTW